MVDEPEARGQYVSQDAPIDYIVSHRVVTVRFLSHRNFAIIHHIMLASNDFADKIRLRDVLKVSVLMFSASP